MADLSSFEDHIQLRDKIAEDLGWWGDDNYFFLLTTVEKYNLDHSTFDYSEHFEDETEIITPLIQLLTPIIIVAWLSWLLVERAFPGQFQQPDFLKEKTDNPRLDLTVGDLIVWRLAGRFCLREEADIRIA